MMRVGRSRRMRESGRTELPSCHEMKRHGIPQSPRLAALSGDLVSQMRTSDLPKTDDKHGGPRRDAGEEAPQ